MNESLLRGATLFTLRGRRVCGLKFVRFVQSDGCQV